MTRSCIKKQTSKQSSIRLPMRWVAKKWPRTLLFHVGCTFLLLLGNNHLGRGSAQCPLPCAPDPRYTSKHYIQKRAAMVGGDVVQVCEIVATKKGMP